MFCPNINFTIHPDLGAIFHDTNSAECIAVELALFDNSSRHMSKIIICEIYCPPNRPVTPFLCSLDTLLRNASGDGARVYIMGDMNIDLLRFPNSSASVDLLNTFVSKAFIPLVNCPTRVTTCGMSLIDVLFTNDFVNIIASMTYVLTCTISDHFLIAHSSSPCTRSDVNPGFTRHRRGFLINQSTLSKLKDSHRLELELFSEFIASRSILQSLLQCIAYRASSPRLRQCDQLRFKLKRMDYSGSN